MNNNVDSLSRERQKQTNKSITGEEKGTLGNQHEGFLCIWKEMGLKI